MMTKIGKDAGVTGVGATSDQGIQTRPPPAPQAKPATFAPVASGAKLPGPKPLPAKLETPTPKPGDEARWSLWMTHATSEAKDGTDALLALDKETHFDLKPHRPEDQDKVAAGLHKAEGHLKTAEAKLAAAKKELKRREGDPNANLSQITSEVAALEAEVKTLKSSIATVRTSAIERGFLPATDAKQKAEAKKAVATSAAQEKADQLGARIDAQGYVYESIKDPPMSFPPSEAWAKAKAQQQKTIDKCNASSGVPAHRERTQAVLADAKAFMASPEFAALPPDKKAAFKAKVEAHAAVAQQNGWS